MIIRSIGLSVVLTVSHAIYSCQIDTFYGTYVTKEPCIEALIENAYVQRLKKIHQYGPRQYAIKQESYTRFDHSVGVMHLLHRFGASTQEQIAGLLHDVSHTVFSHVGDLLFNRSNNQYAYQDEIHANFLQVTSLHEVLRLYGYTVEQIAGNKEQYRALEQELPDICADRLEYNLQGGFVHGLLSKDDVAHILDDLRYENDCWYFICKNSAKKFSEVPLILMLEVWSSPENMYIYEQASKMLMRALEIKLLGRDDIHYGCDDEVWERVGATNDSEILRHRNNILEYKKHVSLDEKEYTAHHKPKFRGIDPLVKVDGKLVRLTTLDDSFAQKYHRAKKIINTGWYIKIS